MANLIKWTGFDDLEQPVARISRSFYFCVELSRGKDVDFSVSFFCEREQRKRTLGLQWCGFAVCLCGLLLLRGSYDCEPNAILPCDSRSIHESRASVELQSRRSSHHRSVVIKPRSTRICGQQSLRWAADEWKLFRKIFKEISAVITRDGN